MSDKQLRRLSKARLPATVPPNDKSEPRPGSNGERRLWPNPTKPAHPNLLQKNLARRSRHARRSLNLRKPNPRGRLQGDIESPVAIECREYEVRPVAIRPMSLQPLGDEMEEGRVRPGRVP